MPSKLAQQDTEEDTESGQNGNYRQAGSSVYIIGTPRKEAGIRLSATRPAVITLFTGGFRKRSRLPARAATDIAFSSRVPLLSLT